MWLSDSCVSRLVYNLQTLRETKNLNCRRNTSKYKERKILHRLYSVLGSTSPTFQTNNMQLPGSAVT